MGSRWPSHTHGEMRVVTINLPVKWLEVIKKLTDNALYPSRSEFIRNAVRDCLRKEQGLYNGFIKPMLETDDVNTIRVPNGDGTYQHLHRLGEA